jgi:O-acetyl-ADP-ribose deacetylase (regulator of RNase III)
MPRTEQITFKNIVFQLIQGDITTSDADAIVNAANSHLAGGGGVDGAIHRAAGPKLLEAGQKYIREHLFFPAGQAMITPGFNLKARHVIHTVGPVWRGGIHDEAEILASCYRSCLELADRHELKTIAFSAISCGVYGYPLKQAAQIALSTLLRHGPSTGLETISVYLYTEEAFAVWVQTMQEVIKPPM